MDEADAFGGLGGLGDSSGDAQSMALLQAMGGIQEAGMRRHASPIGAIADTLAPLLAAPIQARQMEQQNALQSLLLRAKIVDLLRGSGGISPEEAALKTAQAKEAEASAAEKTGRAEYSKKLLENILGGGGGMGGSDLKGMKPSINFGTSGPSVSYRSDVMSPEALQQRKDIMSAGAAQSLEGKKAFENFKQSLPPKMTQKQQDAIEAGHTLISMLDEIPGVVKDLPTDIDRAGLAREAAKYQGRSEHPLAANAITGLTGGLINADTDPRLDPYFATVGQAQAALASFNLTGMRGGWNTLKWLNVHFPGWGDDAATVERKAKFLSSNKGVVKKKIEFLQGRIQKAAEAAGQIGGEPVGDSVRVKVRGPNGQEAYMLIDPETGESSVDPENAE